MKYKIIVDQIVANIRAGKLIVGQRMPSLRQLARQHQVSMTTALNSYRFLEENGWLVARPQSGFFVSKSMITLKQPDQPQFISRSFSIDNYARLADTVKHEHISKCFGISQIAPHYIPSLAIERSIKRGMRVQGEQLHLYQDPQGLQELRYALSEHFMQSGFMFSANDLVITAGCIDAVRVSLEVTTKPGDAVAISSPCFNGLLELLAYMSRKVVEISCTKDGIDIEQLEEHMKNGKITAALFSSSHMNPQGTNISVKQKQDIAGLANKYHIAIIEDDVYAELAYTKTMPLPIKSWDRNGDVLWCGSVSKTLSAGYRLGWCLSGRFQKEMIKHIRISSFGHNSVVQSGLADFIKTGQYRKHLNSIRDVLLCNIRSYQSILQECLPTGSAISQPYGGMVLWIQVPQLDSVQLSKDLEAIGIDMRAGNLFTTRALYRDCFRLNAGWALNDTFDEHRTVEEALRQLIKSVHQQRKAIVKEK